MTGAYRREGITGLISKHRGRVSNHHHDASTKAQIKGLAHQHYADFGPTFAAEKLRDSPLFITFYLTVKSSFQTT
jgi:hypothetical protein